MRLTVSVCTCEAPVDSVGLVKSVELDSADRQRWYQSETKSVFVLHMLPRVLINVEGSTRDTGLGPGVLAVDAVVSLPFSVTVDIPADDNSSVPNSKRSLQVRARRKQLPMTINTASTLYTLQGTTTEPGLIYHFRTPRRLSRSLKWISTYMALSRVRCLKDLRTICISDDIRDLINEGPPGGPLTRFLTLFEAKARETDVLIENVMQELHW